MKMFSFFIKVKCTKCANISVMEQMITFNQFNDEDSSEVTVEFLSVDNLLDKHDSANAAAMFGTIQSNL